MCGFAGMLKQSSLTEEDKNDLKAMSEIIAHRGPDEAGMLYVDNAAFAFRRLSIIDLERGSQPFSYGDGRYTGVFNGEIYNYRELRAQLTAEGYAFYTNSEIEVMLALYQKEGKDFVRRLRGMFAYAFYDKQTKILTAGRDPFGIKPFYYTEKDGYFVFASEAKALYADKTIDPGQIDKSRVQHYLTFQYIPEPDTLHPRIRILPAGHCLRFDPARENKRSIEKYYTPMFSRATETDFEKKARQLRETVESSVRYHMISDVPVGTFLSSGIDSAIITALASRLNPGIKAFTVAFGEREFSEIEDASAIARHLDVEHIKLVGTVADFKRAFERVVYHLDFPVADPSTVAIYLICEEAARHLKVVLSGEGADELFGGYRVYHETTASSKIYALPEGVKKILNRFAGLLPDRVRGKQLLYRGTTPLERRYVGNAFIFREEEKAALLKTYSSDTHFSQLTAPAYAEAAAAGLTPMQKMQYIDMNHWLRGDILVKGDRLSMAHSLEVRVPFLDKEVFRVAADLPDRFKLSHGTTKYILRYAFGDLVNRETVTRPKLGYPVPVKKWLRHELYDWAKQIIENSTADEYINKTEALRMLMNHRDGTEDNYRKLWVILVFITWYGLYVK